MRGSHVPIGTHVGQQQPLFVVRRCPDRMLAWLLDNTEPGGPWAATPCAMWLGSVNKGGRGYANVRLDGDTWEGHRLAWELANRTYLRPAEVIHHLCQQPRCIRPEHLVCTSAWVNNVLSRSPAARAFRRALREGRWTYRPSNTARMRAKYRRSPDLGLD